MNDIVDVQYRRTHFGKENLLKTALSINKDETGLSPLKAIFNKFFFLIYYIRGSNPATNKLNIRNFI